jgi:hypothetical protein
MAIRCQPRQVVKVERAQLRSHHHRLRHPRQRQQPRLRLRRLRARRQQLNQATRAKVAVAQVGSQQPERNSPRPTMTMTTRSWSRAWLAAAVVD